MTKNVIYSLTEPKFKDELKVVAEACAKGDFCLELTGGIDMENFGEKMGIIIDAGVEWIIPHVYTSIINSKTGCTKIECVEHLLGMIKKMV